MRIVKTLPRQNLSNTIFNAYSITEYINKNKKCYIEPKCNQVNLMLYGDNVYCGDILYFDNNTVTVSIKGDSIHLLDELKKPRIIFTEKENKSISDGGIESCIIIGD